MDVEVDGVIRQGIFDAGATDSICASCLAKSPDYKYFCAIKVGNGNFEYSEGETTVEVDLGTFKLPHECVCLNTTAFDVCIGINFVRQNPGVIIGCLFNPAKLFVNKGEELNLVSLERRVEGLPETPKVQLRMGNKQSYRLVSKIREDALLELRCNPEVDLYANTVNAVEGLFLYDEEQLLPLLLAVDGHTMGKPSLVTPLQTFGDGCA